jgi:MFS superfamily sulfate permease-like transporter
MTYSNSVLYAKSGGDGMVSGLAIVFLTMIMFVIGPSIASYLPRCMAGTLLLHIGIDLILEGVYDCELQPNRVDRRRVNGLLTISPLPPQHLEIMIISSTLEFG